MGRERCHSYNAPNPQNSQLSIPAPKVSFNCFHSMNYEDSVFFVGTTLVVQIRWAPSLNYLLGGGAGWYDHIIIKTELLRLENKNILEEYKIFANHPSISFPTFSSFWVQTPQTTVSNKIMQDFDSSLILLLFDNFDISWMRSEFS